VSFRAGLQQDSEETVSMCQELIFVGTGYRIQRFQWQGICVIVFVLIPPTNPTPRLYPRVMWIRTLGNVEGIPC